MFLLPLRPQRVQKQWAGTSNYRSKISINFCHRLLGEAKKKVLKVFKGAPPSLVDGTVQCEKW